jgi:hypothetical protein
MNTFATQNEKKMQKTTEEPLLKERSPRAALSAGFRLYTGNFRHFLKSTWLMALVTSLICGATATVIFIYWPELLARAYSNLPNAWQLAGQYYMLLTAIIVLTVLSFIAIIIFWGFGGSALIKIHQKRKISWWKALKIMITRLFRISPRYWGRLFLVLLVSIIVLGILDLLVSTPEFLLWQANWQAHVGVVGGDDLGMPGYMTALTFITCASVTFLQLYIWLTMLPALYFLYGGIMARKNNAPKALNPSIQSLNANL